MVSTISDGTVHAVPVDMKRMLSSNTKVRSVWEDITPLARNEWICWITSAKKSETRHKRILVGKSKLLAGMRRPCCWAGCTHR